MSAIIEQLKKKIRRPDGSVSEEMVVYPVTRSNAVYMKNGFTTLDDRLADMSEGDSTITFNSDGTILTELQSGNKITTSFLPNGNIQDVCVDKNGKTVYEKITTFNSDGSITTTFDWGEE